MRTITSIEGRTLTIPNETIFLKDLAFVKIEGEVLGEVVVRCYDAPTMSGKMVKYDPKGRNSVTIRINELLQVLYAGGSTSIVLRVQEGNNTWDDFSIEMRKGITLPYRDHGCSRTYSMLFGQPVKHLIMAGGQRRYWQDGQMHQDSYDGDVNETISFDLSGRVTVTMRYDNEDEGAWDNDQSDLIGLGTREQVYKPYQLVSYSTPRKGDKWRNSGDLVYIRPWDIGGYGLNCLPPNGLAVVWDNIDGNRVYAIGHVVNDTITATQMQFRKAGISEIGCSPSQLLTGHEREVAVEFLGIPRDMYLDEILLSDEVFYTIEGLDNLQPAIPSSLSITRDNGEFADVSLSIKIAL